MNAPLGPLGAASGGRCLVMGIINVTPDSFSDGGRFLDTSAAVAHSLRLVADGADLVDVGGESTRPGAGRVSEEEELRRVVPVVEALRGFGAYVSVDTMRSRVAAAAVAAGAVLVNDVSGGLADPAMLPFLADAGIPCVLMHWRAHSTVMDQHANYGSVVEEVRRELADRCEAALAAGIQEDRIVLDPGLGFAKTNEHSWSVLAGLPRLLTLGFPVLVGASRKRFLAECLDYGGLDGAQPVHRDDASAAAAALAAAAGAWGVRVHAVSAAAAATRCVSRLRAATPDATSESVRTPAFAPGQG
ncbi:dihydropteroate synthase [Kribbella sp. NPDC023972]|uniref:dihydropteroate synthase n=1 Tax=Kribbella sp. NPDC023972 TaxID=3154795 RepID=UPI0033FA6708